MRCEKCQTNEATMHLTQIVEGRAASLHLCPDCARKLGLALPQSPMDMESFLKRLFGLAPPKPPAVPPPDGEDPADALPSVPDNDDDDNPGLPFPPDEDDEEEEEDDDELSDPMEADDTPCPGCGTPHSFVASSKFAACPACLDFYLRCHDDFPVNRAPEAPAPLRAHFGKVPLSLSADARREVELERLRDRLLRAVAEERFEEAHGLRKRIKDIETARIAASGARNGAPPPPDSPP